MFGILKKFFTDETAFIGYLRFLLLAGGAAVTGDFVALPMSIEWLGPVLMGAAGFIRAGEPNKSKATD